MFGSRDVWFVVGLPVFLYAQGWHYMEVAGLPRELDDRLWRSSRPSRRVVRRSPDGLSREVPAARLWGAVLAVIPVVLALADGKPSGRRAPIWS